MKISLTILLSVLIAFKAISQPNSKPCPPGSTCLPDHQLTKVIQSNEEGKLAKQLVALLENKILILEEDKRLLFRVVSSKDSTIADQRLQVNSLKQVHSNDMQIISNKDAEISIHKTALRKQKRKTVFVGIAGALISGAILYFKR